MFRWLRAKLRFQDDEISREVEKRLREGETFPSTFADQPDAPLFSDDSAEPDVVESPIDDWVMTMVTLVLSLLAILLLLYLLLYFYNKVLGGRLPTLQGKFNIRTVSAFHLGPKQKIVVLSVNDQYFACGVTPHQINFLTELRDQNDQSFLSNVSATKEKIQFDADQTRAEFLKTLDSARRQAQQMAPQAQSGPGADSQTHNNVSKPEPSVSKTNICCPENRKRLRAPPRNPLQQIPKKKQSNDLKLPFPSESNSSEWDNSLANDSSMQQFAKQLSKKLKSLKPIDWSKTQRNKHLFLIPLFLENIHDVGPKQKIY